MERKGPRKNADGLQKFRESDIVDDDAVLDGGPDDELVDGGVEPLLDKYREARDSLKKPRSTFKPNY